MIDFENNIEHKVVSISSSGDNTLITAPVGGYIAIDHINLVPAGAVNVTLKSGSDALSGAYPLTTSQGFVLENSSRVTKGVVNCADSEAFVINLSGAVAVYGFIRYRIVK